MERFKPDNWWEGMLRPLLLADPEGGLYLEFPAPDLRFLLLIIVSLFLLKREYRERLPKQTRNVYFALLICTYLWTFVSGNGRYFLAGLFLVGPLLVVFLWKLPFTAAMRGVLIALCSALQFSVVTSFSQRSPWVIAKTQIGGNIALEASSLRETPSVFLTIGGNAHAALVPLFDPNSQWANLGGHHRRGPDAREGLRLSELLHSSQPKYAVMPILADAIGTENQPNDQARLGLLAALTKSGLSWSNNWCEPILFRSKPAGSAAVLYGSIRGFWFCGVEQVVSSPTVELGAPVPDLLKRAMSRIESDCSRFFPPGGGDDAFDGEEYVRHYSATDTQIRVKNARWVYYSYYRSFASTFVGDVSKVTEGTATVPCGKLAGRYRVPWQRE